MEQKDAWWYKQSGVIPYRTTTKNSSENPQVEVLLITSRKRKRWIIPKGIVERHLSPSESAEKEALEEAGIAGKISQKAIGSYTRNKWGGTCTIEVFLLEVTEMFNEWPERLFRDRRWMSLEEAIEYTREEQLKALFRKLPESVKRKT